VKNIDTSGMASKLTHINYAFGNVSEQGRCFEANQAGVGDAWADYQTRFAARRHRQRRGRRVQPAAGRQLQPAQAAQGEVPQPQGEHLARRLDLVEVLLERGAAGQPGRRSWRAASTCSSRATCR
jgi:hypothetical protein